MSVLRFTRHFVRQTRFLSTNDATRLCKNCFSSALYIIGERATDVCVVVNPHIEWSGDVQELQDNLRRRGAEKLIDDAEQLQGVWEFYNKLKTAKECMESKIIANGVKLKDLYQKEDPALQEELDKYKMHHSMMKQEMKTIKSSLWAAEEKAILKILALPNHLHPKTPDDEPSLIYEHGTPPSIDNPASHVDVGIEKDLLQLYSGQIYYLKNDAAMFELGCKFHFSECLREIGYIQFSNSDIVKSVVVEGCGINHRDSDSVFILHHNEDSKLDEDLRLHLVGGGSLFSFAAYHTRNIIPQKYLPLRYFTLGRQYKPVPLRNQLGLFQVTQSAVVELFSMVENFNNHLDDELLKVIEVVKSIYQSFGYHFRVCYIPAQNLSKWENLRVSFQMFSPYLKSYIEIGNISISDDYISKRLQIQYKHDKSLDYTKIISGTLISVPKFLGCVLESNPEEFKMPNILKKYFDSGL